MPNYKEAEREREKERERERERERARERGGEGVVEDVADKSKSIKPVEAILPFYHDVLVCSTLPALGAVRS